jgi:hypothetical protein
MSEPAKKNLPPPLPGGKTPASNPADMAGVAGHSNPVAGNPASVPAASVAVAPVSSPARFGGHVGGGKRRADGLVAGSAEAIEADKKKDAERKRLARAAKTNSTLPPPLPRAASTAANENSALGADSSGVPAPVDLPAVNPGVVAAPLFVPWSEKILARPIKLLTKIIDRVRCSSLMKRVKKLALTPAQEKEIEADIVYKSDVVADFNNALTVCAAMELNKRRVPGAEHSHWLDVVLCGGELVTIHLNTIDKLEKMVAENNAKKN